LAAIGGGLGFMHSGLKGGLAGAGLGYGLGHLGKPGGIKALSGGEEEENQKLDAAPKIVPQAA